jgi:Skp family chaperone for outer membrane proteins
MKNSLSSKGLSMSQAQSISNLCNQRAKEISTKLDNINNVSKKLVIGDETYTETQGNPIPDNVVFLLQEKASLSATQAFLMENIKAKDELINEIRFEVFDYSVEEPLRPKEVSEVLPSEVNEEWGWDQLTQAEYNEYLEAEAYASHIGQFIHKRGTLDRLRAELPNIKTLEFMEIESGKKTPLKVTIHHTSEQLLGIHEELAALHRGYEQRVNYFKAKVKNSVTSENAKIQRERADIQSRVNTENEKLRREYADACSKFYEERKKASQEFEAKRQERIQEAANLKINVAERFQGVVDTFLNQLK